MGETISDNAGVSAMTFGGSSRPEVLVNPSRQCQGDGWAAPARGIQPFFAEVGQ